MIYLKIIKQKWNALKFVTRKFYRSYFTMANTEKTLISDRAYIKKLYKIRTGKELNLKNPKTFNEKMQWLKLHNRKPIYTTMVDKYSVKDYVSKIIDKKYIIPTIAVYDKPEDIDFDALPNQFVLKTTHDSGGVVVCKDKTKLDVEKVLSFLNFRLSMNFYKTSREWPYKNVKRRIIAEEFIEDDINQELRVYKVFNFNGEPKIIQMINGDKTDHEYINYYDTQWNLLELKQNFPNGPIDEQPSCLQEILDLSRKLSVGMPFIRTDFYEAKGQVLFSEFTFFSDAGFANFEPEEWDRKLGDMIKLPFEK